MKRFAMCAVLSLTSFASFAQAQEMPAAYKQVLDTLGKTGDFKDNVLKVNIPRNDLSITVANVKTPTPFGFGGWVALWLAAKYPDLVEHLVLEGPAGLRDKGTGGVPADPEARMRALYAHPERAPAETRSPQMIADTVRARDFYMGGVDFDAALHEALPRITARTLVIMGTKDTVAPVIVAHRIKAAVANSHVTFIYGAAHSLEFDAPERVGPLVSRFLERGEAFVVRSPDAA